MITKVDNKGAIFMANNAGSGSRTKHIDARVHFVRDLTQAVPRILETEFVPSEENQSDTLTKNTSNQLFWKHTDKYMIDMKPREDVEMSDLSGNESQGVISSKTKGKHDQEGLRASKRHLVSVLQA